MVEGGLAFLGVVGNDHVEVVEGNVFLGSGLHNADTPVDIGGVAITEVVGRGDGEIGTGVEGLMTDEHTVTEGFPGEVLWGRETAVVKKSAFRVDDVRISIKHCRFLTKGTVPIVR